MFSNYSIKKILPRLIIVAIAVNVSFYICAAMVDLSNILGVLLRDFIRGIAGSSMPDQSIMDNFGAFIGGGFLGWIGNLAIGIGALILILCNLGAVFVGFLLVLAVLALRETLLTVLIIISPIAFVLYLLPNTEKWFKKWINEFARCLFVFPVIAFVWGATELVTYVIMNAQISRSLGIMEFVTICLIQLVPVATILPIMKMGGQALGKLQGLAEKGLAMTPLKDIGNAAGHAAKSAGFQAISNRVSAGHNEWLDAKRKRDTALKEHAAAEAAWQSETDTEKKAELKAIMDDKKTALDSTQISLDSKKRRSITGVLGRGIGGIAGLGDSNIKKLAEAASEVAQANTSSARGVTFTKSKMELAAGSSGESIRHQAKMFGLEDKYKSGVGGSEYRAAKEAAIMNPNSSAAQARFSEVQNKMANDNNAMLENSGQISVMMKDGSEERLNAKNASELLTLLNNENNGISDEGRDVLKKTIANRISREMSEAKQTSDFNNIYRLIKELGNTKEGTTAGFDIRTLQGAVENQHGVMYRQEKAAGGDIATSAVAPPSYQKPNPPPDSELPGQQQMKFD